MSRPRPSPSRFYPVFPVPEDWFRHVEAEDLALAEDGPEPERHAFLRGLVLKGLRWCYGPEVLLRRADAVARAHHELSVIESVGYADYFLIVWDIVREAGAREIPVLARGSAADSLVCYCLGISSVCPLWFDLYFERFLNHERSQFSKLADIDLDFPWDQRDEMIAYVFERWGHDHVAMIGGFNRFHARAAVGDLAKIHGLSESETRAFTRRLPYSRADDIARAVAEIPFLESDLPMREQPYPEILEMAARLEDVPRHASMHPCGIVISREPLADVMPLQPSGRGPRMTQFDMDAVEALGFVKIDLLGQAGLSVLRDVKRILRDRHGITVDLEKIPWDDAATWEMIASGGARGVHHIESPAMTSLLVQANCRDMRCLCAIVSVIRPGAADESKKLAFTRRHQGFEEAVYPHPVLESCLRDTYGLLVYEEHILMVAHHFAGMNLGRADMLRRELVKMKSPEKLAELGVEFVEKARERGRADEEIRHVWTTLVHFHGYMFNKAHSASYAVEAYQAAWLKCRWPAESMAAVLDNERGFYSPFFYTLEARRLGIRVLGPDINRSAARWQSEPQAGGRAALRPPLRWIKGLGRPTLERWERERKIAPFVSPADFIHRVAPGREERDRLLDAGAFDGFGRGRAAIFWEISRLPELPAGDLFSLAPSAGPILPEELSEPSPAERAAREMELLGFPHSLDPFDHLAPGFDWDRCCRSSRLAERHGRQVLFAGLLVQSRRTHTLKGEVMFFGTLADHDGFTEISLFPSVFRRCGHVFERGGLVVVLATVEAFDNGRGQTLDVAMAWPATESPKPRPKPEHESPAGT
jgi:DNA-directed DNA polymerase III PolC